MRIKQNLMRIIWSELDVKMLSKKLLLFCDILLLVDAINETTFYEDINISDKKNHIANQDLEYAESYENNQISDEHENDKDGDGDLDYAGPVDAGQKKGKNFDTLSFLLYLTILICRFLKEPSGLLFLFTHDQFCE